MSEAIAKHPDFDIRGLDRVTVDSYHLMYLESFQDGSLFKMMGTDRVEYITNDQIANWLETGKMKIERNFYSVLSAEKRALGIDLITDLADDERELIVHKYSVVEVYRRFLADFGEDPTEEEKQKALDLAWIELDERLLKVDGSSEKKRVWRRVCLKTVKNWDRKLRACNDDPSRLEDGRRRSGNRTERFLREQLALMQEAIVGFLHEGRPSVKSQFEVLEALFWRENKARKQQGLEKLKCPARTTFYERIDRINPFLRDCMRWGVEEAQKRHRSTGDGEKVFRPGSRGQIDGWSMELHTLLSDTPEWRKLTPKQIKKLKTVRLLVIVVMDVATRCITGIHLSLTEDAEAGVAALRFAMGPKDDVAKANGCRSTWPMHLAGLLTGDTGAAWIDSWFTAVALDATGGIRRSVVGIPWLRGHIERFFKTMAGQLLGFFTGRAFGSIAERGDYPAQERASVDFETIRTALVRYIVDVYHHSYHSELGMSPFAAWYAMGAKSPPPPALNAGRIAAIFGKRITRTLYGEGVVFLNQHYNSPQLQEAMSVIGVGKEVRVKVDTDDLGSIAVEVPFVESQDELGLMKLGRPHVWISVPGPAELQGVTLWQFKTTAEHLENLHGKYDPDSEDIRNAAILEIRALAQQAANNRLKQPMLTSSAALKHAMKGYYPGLVRRDGGVVKRLGRDQLERVHAPIEITGKKAKRVAPEAQAQIKVTIRKEGE